MQSGKYDVIIIGSGHNGLVTAAYLAKHRLRVAVLEKRSIVGGCAITEETWPGYKISTLSYVNSLFRPQIVKDLRLKEFGFDMLPRSPSSFTPFLDGRGLLMGPDKKQTCAEIAKFSSIDAGKYEKYEAMLDHVGQLLEPLLETRPPNLTHPRLTDAITLGSYGFRNRKALKAQSATLIRFLTGCASDILHEWFESDELKATLATDAIIGANASPRTPGTAYVLLHHVMGECNGVRGVWGYVRGGMGALTQSLAQACRAAGVDIFTDSGVNQIVVRNGRAVGVVVKGQELTAKAVASCASPQITFAELTAAADLPEAFMHEVRRINYDSASVKLNFVLSELPHFIGHSKDPSAPHYRGTIHISPSMDYIEDAYADSVRGEISRHPILECTIPSVLDDTLAPQGHYVMNIFSQYGPYQLRNGKSWDTERDAYRENVIATMEAYAPNFRKSIVHCQVITPVDLERDYGLTGGNIFHGRMNADQMFNMRPVPGYADYRSPIQGLYLCGAGAHPGGGVLGQAGLNASRVILQDLC